ncbi:S41 family peptidase [Streptomyces sp. NPDC047928]|uniref:S41 family peptidase n=1 Tax=unclassified Streptomyces TaxID=2593676 RepID=UPI00371249BD
MFVGNGRTRRRRRAAGVAAAVLAVTAVAVGAAGPAAAGEGPPVGVWAMDGYGTVLSVEPGRLREYQVTAVSCAEGYTAERSGGDGGTARYTTDDLTVLTLRAGGGHGRASLHIDGSTGDRGLRRVAALPEVCTDTAPADGPVAAFDAFWQTFAENYPFFAAKGVDWSAVRDRYRPRIGPDTTRDELFAVFGEMVAPLNDAHVVVSEKDGPRFFFAVRPGTVLPGPDLDTKVKTFVQERDLNGRPLQEYARGRVSYADLPGGRGYLRVSGFAGYTEENSYAANGAELDRALDAILSRERVARLKGLVVDLRINGGGSDALGLRIASRLTDRPYFAYAKRVRDDPWDATSFTRPQPLYVRPAAAPRYTGPVAVLTGGSTFSAGETFIQALMERPGARTVRIGQATQGVFSDVLARALPGGWQLGLPNEEFLTRAGRTFDGTGIPPHIEVPVFTDEEFARRRDSAFDAAVGFLGGRPGR